MSLFVLQQGDPVRVFDSGIATRVPAGGFEGNVWTSGHKYLTVLFRRGADRPEEQIRVLLTTGKSTDPYSRYTVLTPREAEDQVARRQHMEALRSVGLTVISGTPPAGLLAALAATVETWRQEHSDD